MPRAYTVATAALALELPVKWLDNVLSHHTVPGVRQHKQGVSRHLSVEGLLILGLGAFLIRELGVPTPRAISMADMIIKSKGRYTVKEALTLQLDVAAFQAELLERLDSAVEIAPVPRRGRPPTSKTGRLE